MQFDPLKRREFITLPGGAAAAWPLTARAQTIRRIGMLLPAAADDAEFQTRTGAFLEGLQQSGWTIGQNVQIESRWASSRNGCGASECSTHSPVPFGRCLTPRARSRSFIDLRGKK